MIQYARTKRYVIATLPGGCGRKRVSASRCPATRPHVTEDRRIDYMYKRGLPQWTRCRRGRPWPRAVVCGARARPGIHGRGVGSATGGCSPAVMLCGRGRVPLTAGAANRGAVGNGRVMRFARPPSGAPAAAGCDRRAAAAVENFAVDPRKESFARARTLPGQNLYKGPRRARYPPPPRPTLATPHPVRRSVTISRRARSTAPSTSPTGQNVV